MLHMCTSSSILSHDYKNIASYPKLLSSKRFLTGHNREFEKHNKPRPNIKSSYTRFIICCSVVQSL